MMNVLTKIGTWLCNGDWNKWNINGFTWILFGCIACFIIGCTFSKKFRNIFF